MFQIKPIKKQVLAILLLFVLPTIYAQDRPNILWLTYEDTSPEFIACYGNEKANTPNIDKLAKEGVQFSAAYSTAAVCSPSRFCLFTGIPADNVGTGNHRSKYKVAPEVKGFPYYLRQAGYYTSNNSKTDYNIFNAKELTKEAWDESSKKAGWWNRAEGQPFFAVYNSMSSHQSRTMTEPYKKYETLVLKELDKTQIIADNDIILPDYLHQSTEMNKEFARVYNSISLMDKEFGQWIDRLEEDGLLDNTIIFCFSDHGEGITRAKGTATSTGFRVPFIVWFPERYKHLSPWGTGVVTDQVVSFEDLAPTILDLAGVDIPNYMHGYSLLNSNKTKKREFAFSGVDRTDESSELSRSVQDGKYQYVKVYRPYQPFIRWNMYYDVSDMQQIARKNYEEGKLNQKQAAFLEARSSEYFFDTSNDKWGMNNYIFNNNYKRDIKKLKKALNQNLIKVNDPHFIPEYVYYKNIDKTPVELAKDNYPLAKILKVANTIGMGADKIKIQCKSLENKNRYIRYWAAIGLFSQENLTYESMLSIDKLFDEEDFPPTKITMAMSLYKFGNDEYTAIIKELILNSEPIILQEVLNLLITLDINQIEPFLDELNKVQESKDKTFFACKEYIKMIKNKVYSTALR